MAAAVAFDPIASILGGQAGMVAGSVAKPWFYATCFFILLTFFFLFMTIKIAKNTNAFRELRAHSKGRRVCWFFDDTRTAEMRVIEPSAGIVHDDIYGDYIINEKGTYVDKRTRNVIIPFSTSVALGGEVKHFMAADQLAHILGDEKELQKIALALANGELKDTRFDALRMSVNFGALKSFSNTMIPHNITAKINMEIAKRVKSYGKVDTNSIIWFVVIGLGLIFVAALVLYMIMGNHGGGGTTYITNGMATAANMTGALRG